METIEPFCPDPLETIIFTDIVEKNIKEATKSNLTPESIDFLIKQVKSN